MELDGLRAFRGMPSGVFSGIGLPPAAGVAARPKGPAGIRTPPVCILRRTGATITGMSERLQPTGSAGPDVGREDPGPALLPRIGRDGVMAWVDPAWGSAPAELLGEPREGLDALFALEPSSWLRKIPGRGTFAWEPAGQRLVVKRFVGDLGRDRWYARWRGRPVESPAQREAQNLRELEAQVFPVPRALAWFAEPGHRGRSGLVMAHLDHDEHLRAAIDRSGSDAQRGRLDRLAALVARFHAAGWYHRDLYLEHVVIRSGEPQSGEGGDLDLALIDVGRARREAEPRRRWFVKDVAALLHSSPERVPPPARLRFLSHYLDARGIMDLEARRTFGQEVERKAASLAAHSPRYVDLHLDPL